MRCTPIPGHSTKITFQARVEDPTYLAFHIEMNLDCIFHGEERINDLFFSTTLTVESCLTQHFKLPQFSSIFDVLETSITRFKRGFASHTCRRTLNSIFMVLEASITQFNGGFAQRNVNLKDTILSICSPFLKKGMADGHCIDIPNMTSMPNTIS